ncbi:hydantoinase B/oxoprolinase family protein [Litoribrevibacter euphylliae]|uniref:Hydantoinase B/oxoprolinase family protein n=1 Tax=Litoribrevibacter euphylliae TaxID=1834034 RepID=A0ABV7HAE9_9GAMM
MDPIELGILVSRFESICEEMGAILQQSSFSPNIKDRMDFSCALFDADGGLLAQAAHIPVHLGSMAYAMKDIVSQVDWQSGDVLVLNNPYMGGTHLPDVTMVAPFFYEGQVQAFIANRAHHANIGAEAPGSMPLSTHIDQEGILIDPVKLVVNGQMDEALLTKISSGNALSRGDFLAQLGSVRAGLDRFSHLVNKMSVDELQQAVFSLNAYGEKLALAAFQQIPDGDYDACDYLDGDGIHQDDNHHIQIQLKITSKNGRLIFDFEGTDPQVQGNVNCPLSVAAASVFYVLRCLMPDQAPSCDGVFRTFEIKAPKGSLLNANYPSAVAAGNVETSMRVVDVVMKALSHALPERISAASHGSMNNVAMGSRNSEMVGQWDYYETIGGGLGASASANGLSAVQAHMTNTSNTPVESLELHYPIRVLKYAIREGSGGKGAFSGGDGIERCYQFKEAAQVTLLTERRELAPYGLAKGEAAEKGLNQLNDEVLPGKCSITVKPNDRLTIMTAGGGGYGSLEKQ